MTEQIDTYTNTKRQHNTHLNLNILKYNENSYGLTIPSRKPRATFSLVERAVVMENKHSVICSIVII